MISGMIQFNLRKIILMVLSLQLYYPIASFADTELNDLLLPFTKVSLIQFTYHESRISVFFKTPQISHGKILFKYPDQVIKEVLKPEYQKYELTKNSLVISNSNGSDRQSHNKKQVNINNYPQLKQFIELIKALLSGNIEFLQQHYNMKIKSKEQQSWTLLLAPRFFPDEMEQRTVKSIQIQGSDEQINSIKITGFGGEQSELTIEQILNKQFK